MIKPEDIKLNRRRAFLVTLTISLSLLASLSALIVVFSSNVWMNKKRMVAISPNTTRLPQVFTYVESVSNEVNEDYEVKNFIYSYIKKTRDRSTIADYQSVSYDKRYFDSEKFSSNLMAAKEMTAPNSPERAYVLDLWANSAKTYKILTERSVSNHFLIDGIFVEGRPDTGAMRAVVVGGYENYFDKEKSDLPADFIGYRVVEMILIRGAPSEDESGSLNPYGYYVFSTYDQFINQAQRDKIIKNMKDSHSSVF